jgi:hypothetical protein
MFSAVTQISALCRIFAFIVRFQKSAKIDHFFSRNRWIRQGPDFAIHPIPAEFDRYISWKRVKNGIRHQPNSSLPPVSSTLMTYHPQHSLCSTLSSRVRTRRAIHLLYFWERENIEYHSFPNHNYVLCYRSNAHVSSQPPHHCLVLHPLQQSSCLRQVLILENRISGIMCHKRRAGSGLTSCTRLGPWSNFPSRIGCLWPSFNK